MVVEILIKNLPKTLTALPLPQTLTTNPVFFQYFFYYRQTICFEQNSSTDGIRVEKKLSTLLLRKEENNTTHLI